MRIFQLRYHPVVQRTVILKLQRAQRMCHTLNGILNRMCKIIHRVDAPLIARVMMRHPGDPVDNRIPHVNIRGGHVDLCPQHLAPVREFACPHSAEQIQIFLYRAVPIGAFLSGFGERPPVFPYFFRGEIADKGFSLPDQFFRRLIHLVKVIGSEEQPSLPVRAKPGYISLDRLDKFRPLLHGVCVIKTEIEFSPVFFGNAIIQKNRLCVADMKIPVRFRRKSGADLLVLSLFEILINDLLDKISGGFLLFLCRFLCHFFSVLSHDELLSLNLFCEICCSPPRIAPGD